jgi:hypothetical protein
MFGKLIRSLFGYSRTTSAASVATWPPDKSLEPLHTEFCQTFCHQPGVNFSDFLRREKVTRLIDWLDWKTGDPIAQSFIRQAVECTRRGENFGDKPGISLLFEGNYDRGGKPNQASQDALSVLAQVLGKPVKLYYHDKPGGTPLVMEFRP